MGADGENYQVRELAEIVAETVPGCRVQFGPHAGPDPRSYRVNFSKLSRRLPACAAKWTARAGAREVYEAVKQAGLSAAEFQGRKFVRLNQLKYLLANQFLDDELRWRKP